MEKKAGKGKKRHDKYHHVEARRQKVTYVLSFLHLVWKNFLLSHWKEKHRIVHILKLEWKEKVGKAKKGTRNTTTLELDVKR